MYTMQNMRAFAYVLLVLVLVAAAVEAKPLKVCCNSLPLPHVPAPALVPPSSCV